MSYYFVNKMAAYDYLDPNWQKFLMKYQYQYFKNISARIGTLDTPWKIKVLPGLAVPEIKKDFSLTFSDITDNTANQLKRQIELTGNPALISFSGGIDSTLVVSAILKNFTPAELDMVSIGLSQTSIQENPEFYKNFIAPNFNVLSLTDYSLNDLYDLNYIVVTGIGGDEIFGPFLPEYTIRNLETVIHKPYRVYADDVIKFFGNDDLSFGKWMFEMIDKNIQSVDIDIDSVFDFLWWQNFNLKYTSMTLENLVLASDVDIRKALTQTVHWFLNDDYQRWSMARNEIKTQFDPLNHKFPAKQYIYDLDKNYWYYKYKIKMRQGEYADKIYYPNDSIFAVTEDYKRITWKEHEEN